MKALGTHAGGDRRRFHGNWCEATARQAYELGFNVSLAIDAMTDMRAEAHDYSIRNVFPRLGEIGTSQEIIDLLPARRA